MNNYKQLKHNRHHNRTWSKIHWNRRRPKFNWNKKAKTLRKQQTRVKQQKPKRELKLIHKLTPNRHNQTIQPVIKHQTINKRRQKHQTSNKRSQSNKTDLLSFILLIPLYLHNLTFEHHNIQNHLNLVNYYITSISIPYPNHSLPIPSNVIRIRHPNQLHDRNPQTVQQRLPILITRNHPTQNSSLNSPAKHRK